MLKWDRRGKSHVRWSKVGVCKKSTNRKKPTETDQAIAKFSVRFGFGFEFLKPKIFGSVFSGRFFFGRFECTKLTETKPNYIIL